MANEEEVKLFGVRGSPFSCRVEIALKMKGVKYEYIREDLSNKSASLLKYNPVHKKIPVLLHNGNPIAESLVIIEYIEDTWKSGIPILPKDLHEMAKARFWAKFIDDKVKTMIKAVTKTGKEHEEAAKETEEALEILEQELKGKKFFGGERIGLADISATFLGRWFGVLGEVCGTEYLSEKKYPRIKGWINEYLESDIMKQTLPTRFELLSVFPNEVQTQKMMMDYIFHK